MADETSKPSKAADAGNTATTGDHDRVQMLSLRADGSHDQLNPEIIGDPEIALKAAKEQFAQQAVSAVDVHERGASSSTGEYDDAPQDPTIEALKAKHDAAAKAAEAAAEKMVKGLTP